MQTASRRHGAPCRADRLQHSLEPNSYRCPKPPCERQAVNPCIEARHAFRKLSLSPRSKLKNAAGPLTSSTRSAPSTNALSTLLTSTPSKIPSRDSSHKSHIRPKIRQQLQAQPGPFAPDSSESIAPADSCPDSQDDPTKNASASTGPDASRHKRKIT